MGEFFVCSRFILRFAGICLSPFIDMVYYILAMVHMYLHQVLFRFDCGCAGVLRNLQFSDTLYSESTEPTVYSFCLLWLCTPSSVECRNALRSTEYVLYVYGVDIVGEMSLHVRTKLPSLIAPQYSMVRYGTEYIVCMQVEY